MMHNSLDAVYTCLTLQYVRCIFIHDAGLNDANLKCISSF